MTMTQRAQPGTGTTALTVAVTSGKGGVGKTTTTANLAVCLARAGLRVVLVDADMSLANLDLVLGLVPEKTIEHFFRGESTLEQVATPGPHGIQLIAAGSGLPELATLPDAQLSMFNSAFDELRSRCDVLLIDTAAGIGENVSQIAHLSDRVLLVTWPDPAAIVDAYAALKVMHTRGLNDRVGLVVNGAASSGEAKRVHAQIETAAHRFLDVRVQLEGFVLRDDAVLQATRRQTAVVQSHPLSAASRCYERLALHVQSMTAKTPTAVEAAPAARPKSWEVLH